MSTQRCIAVAWILALMQCSILAESISTQLNQPHHEEFLGAAPAAQVFHMTYQNATQCGGVCQSIPIYNGIIQSAQYFCDSHFAYYVTYNDDACQIIQSINQYNYDCVSEFEESSQFQCIDSELGPAVPFTWPPEGFVIQNSCLQGPGCFMDPYGECYLIATSSNACVPTYPFDYQFAQKTFCTSDSSMVGVATYYDTTCDDASLLTVTLQSVCPNSTICSGPTLSTPLPSAGYYINGAQNCTGPIEYMQLQTPGSCLNNYVVSCTSTNQYVSTFYTVEVPVQPGGPSCQDFAGNATFATETCVVNEDGDAATYFCNGPPITL